MTETYNSLKKIGYLIRFYRRQRNLSQIEFADELGISYRNLQRMEVGDVEPRLETLSRIANYMNIPISSLIRHTDDKNLFIKEFSANNEHKEFFELQKNDPNQCGDLKLAQRLIKQDSLELVNKSQYAFLDGTKVQLSPDLSELTGITDQNSDIDNYIAFGSALERWEYVFRSKMSRAVIQNYYFFPKGFKVFEEHHFNLKANPDSPTTECYIRDITARHELESWLKLVHAGRIG